MGDAASVPPLRTQRTVLRDQWREAGYAQQEEEESVWKIKTFLTGYAS
jgi:hypothetical protein